MEPPLLLNSRRALSNCVRATRARGEFAEQICATIAMQSWLSSDSRHLMVIIVSILKNHFTILIFCAIMRKSRKNAVSLPRFGAKGDTI